MARCGCAGTQCSCVVRGENGIDVRGAGSVENPYIASANFGFLQAVDTASIDMSVEGTGTSTDPHRISAESLVALDDLVSAAAVGQVPAKQADGTWTGVAPTTAAVGSVTTSNGIEGDGSAGDAVRARLATDSGLTADGSGLRLSTESRNRLNQSYANAAARDAAITAPSQGMRAFLEDGQVWTSYTASGWQQEGGRMTVDWSWGSGSWEIPTSGTSSQITAPGSALNVDFVAGRVYQVVCEFMPYFQPPVGGTQLVAQWIARLFVDDLRLIEVSGEFNRYSTLHRGQPRHPVNMTYLYRPDSSGTRSVHTQFVQTRAGYVHLLNRLHTEAALSRIGYTYVVEL